MEKINSILVVIKVNKITTVYIKKLIIRLTRSRVMMMASGTC